MHQVKYAEVFQKSNTTGWSVRKQLSKRRLTAQTFDSIEDAEEWILANCKSIYGTPWIDHIIEKSSGHLMAIGDWQESCNGGGFIDYDGYGQYVDVDYKFIEDGYIRPSDYTEHKKPVPDNARYVHWYNR